jgi:hypothetical protein
MALNIRNFFKTAKILALVQIAALPMVALADAAVDNNVPRVTVPTNINISKMLANIAAYFFGAVIAACVFMVLWGAFDIATGGDNSDKVTNGKKKILYAMIGLIIAAMSSAIVGLVRTVAGV